MAPALLPAPSAQRGGGGGDAGGGGMAEGGGMTTVSFGGAPAGVAAGRPCLCSVVVSTGVGCSPTTSPAAAPPALSALPGVLSAAAPARPFRGSSSPPPIRRRKFAASGGGSATTRDLVSRSAMYLTLSSRKMRSCSCCWIAAWTSENGFTCWG